MVGGKLTQRTEKEYRAIERDSYSSLAEFCKSRMSYYKKYVERVKEDEDDDQAILMGHLVESLLPGSIGDFDKKFYLSLCPDPPTGQMLDLANFLYKHTANNVVDGVIETDFQDLLKLAYEDVGFKKMKFETVVEKFIGSDAELYYRQLRDTRPKGLKIVCQNDLTNAERIVDELTTNPNTAFWVNLKSDNRYTVYDQLQIEDFDLDGFLLKFMGDRIVIDNQEKTVQPLDWKVTWTVENFITEYYLKRYTYLQAIITHLGLSMTKNKEVLGYDDTYTILPMKFVVADSINLHEPLIYDLTQNDLQNAFEGFTYRGRRYPGLEEIVEDVRWAKENNKFRISRRNYLNKGVCTIEEVKK